MTERRALVVTYHAPQLDRDSGARVVTHLIELMQASGWAISVVALDGVVDHLAVQRLRRNGIAVYDGYRTSIAELLADFPADVAIIAYWSNAARLLPQIRALSPTTRVIIHTIDLHFLREIRGAFVAAEPGAKIGLDAATARRIAQELNTYAAADGLLAISQKEADLLGDLLGSRVKAHWTPDFEDLAISNVAYADRRGILFVGSFQHAPNREAVAYLCREIVPRIDPRVLREHPLSIVGNELDETVRALGVGRPEIHMIGWVPSIIPYLERARVTVLPLLHGAGVKGKLVQALAVGTPSISTTIGIEGLGLADGETVLVADDPGRFANAVTRLITDEGLWRRIADAGRARVLETNGKELARERLLSAIESVLSQQPSRLIPLPILEVAPGTPGTPAASATSTPVVGVTGSAQRGFKPALHRLRDRLPWYLRPNPLFDGEWYLAQYPDVRGARWGAYWHYRRHGWREGRDPNPYFDTDWYLRNNPDVAGAGLEPLDHYLRLGGPEGRAPGPHFDATRYLRANPDVAATGQNPLLHYLRHGRPEGRVATPLAEDSPAAPALPPTPLLAEASNQPEQHEAPPPPASAEPIRTDVRLIAFYLPQFHPIPENDAWWGQGFTEWRSVAQARPQFPGHYQPHVPGDLGFYDLRLPDTRAQQAELAREHGIHGFCYYHYWFGGKQLLERPFNEILQSGEPDFPFCLCWANDPWSRRWDGREDELLMRQMYSPADDLAHIHWLLPALADARAIRVDGKPMFLVYRAKHLPEPARTTDTWRTEAERAGLPGLHLVAVETAWDLGWDATAQGFDAKVLFQPQFGWLMTAAGEARRDVPSKPDLQVYDYDTVRGLLGRLPAVSYRRYESVFPGWDNSPRVGDRAVVMSHANPDSYEQWLRAAVARSAAQNGDHRMVFLNAWNEWAEGCHLEPDRRYGLRYLEATRRAMAVSAGG